METDCQLPLPDGSGLLLSGICGSVRNDLPVEFGCESQMTIDSFTPRQPDSSRGVDAFILSPQGKNAAGTSPS